MMNNQRTNLLHESGNRIAPLASNRLFWVIIFFFYSGMSCLFAQLQHDLVFVQIPAGAIAGPGGSEYSAPDLHVDGARIVLLRKSAAKPVNLTSEFAAASDPDVSFDGNTIIFSGKKNSDDLWQIWRMNVDGSEKVRITDEKGDCFAPVQAGNRFYLDDPQPTPQIIFVGTAHQWFNAEERGPVTALYATDPDGKTVRRLTFNLYSVSSPDVSKNGRIIFSSLQRTGPDGGLALMAINNDGTDLMPFYGNHEKPFYKDMVHVSTAQNRAYFIETDNVAWPGGGISYVSTKRPLHSYKKLSQEGGLFYGACNVPGDGLMASFSSGEPAAVFGIYRIDADKGKRGEKVFSEAGWHSIDVQAVVSSPPVKGRSNWLIPGVQTGVFYCLNSYITNLPEGETVQPGSIRYVRVIEGMPEAEPGSTERKYGNGNGDHRAASFAPQRILGVAPVEADGSFHIRVPAGTPVTFQLLDQDQMALRTQASWSWVMGNENRGCIGCHEDPELSPPNRLVDAVKKPPVELLLPPDQRKTVDFLHQIAPIIESKCSGNGCHVSGKPPENLVLAQKNESELYRTLTAADNGKGYVVPGKARESSLLLRFPGECPDHKGVLTKEERLLFIEWIDLGAQWDIPSLVAPDSL